VGIQLSTGSSNRQIGYLPSSQTRSLQLNLERNALEDWGTSLCMIIHETTLPAKSNDVIKGNLKECSDINL
jgi:hypothetical protein